MHDSSGLMLWGRNGLVVSRVKRDEVRHTPLTYPSYGHLSQVSSNKQGMVNEKYAENYGFIIYPHI
jgi:hypothetical protein